MTRFTPETVRAGLLAFREEVSETYRVWLESVDRGWNDEGGYLRFEENLEPVEYSSMTVERGRDEWDFDAEAEFFAEMRRPYTSARVAMNTVHRMYRGNGWDGGSSIRISMIGSYSRVVLELSDRVAIQRVFDVFEAAQATSRVEPEEVPEIEKPSIFIGHGQSPAWRDLKDHLQDQHGFSVEAYETGARAGHVIRDVLEGMLEKSTFAILVMTSEDEQADESMRARQNVVHEAGLFQGKLGFSRAIVLLEEGTQTFSNIDGIQYIGFPRGQIRAAFGDVLATLRREFSLV